MRHFLIFSGMFCAAFALTAQDTKSLVSKYNGSLSSSIREQPPIFIPECRSPRESIASFFAITREIKSVFEGGSYYGDIDGSQEDQLIDLYAKLTYLLNTETLPVNDRFARTHIIASQLSEVLDRIPVPVAVDIPDVAAIAGKDMKFWRVPNTEIALERLQEGPRKGDWVFSSETVEKSDEFYDRTKDMPYREDANVGAIREQGGLVDHYIAYTGPIIPVNLTDHIPDWMRTLFFGDPLWKYFATTLLLLLLLGIAVLLHRITRFRSDSIENPNHILLNLRRVLLPLSLAILLPNVIHLITIDVRLRLSPLDVTDDILWGIFYIVAFWLTVCVGNVIAAIIIHSPSISPFGLDASLVRLCGRLVSYVVGFWILVEGLQDLGVSLVPLIAGVSVGGLAFALAAKPTLGNILGGVLIFADKPFTVGHRVIIGKHDGVIEDIGLRSTRLRTTDGHLVTLPNDEVCNTDIENIAQRPHVKRILNLTLTYDTSPDKIREAIEMTQQLLSLEEDGGKTDEELGHPGNHFINSEAFPPRVYFTDLNADSLNIMVIYWFSPPNYWDYLAHATWLNTELIERFGKAGIDFAFPTQTLEVKDVTPKAAAETPVEGRDA